MSLFLSKKIGAKLYEATYIAIRSDDEYLFSDSFSEEISRILGTYFLDVDEFALEEFYDPNDKFNIDEKEFRKRTEVALKKLKEIEKRCLES